MINELVYQLVKSLDSRAYPAEILKQLDSLDPREYDANSLKLINMLNILADNLRTRGYVK